MSTNETINTILPKSCQTNHILCEIIGATNLISVVRKQFKNDDINILDHSHVNSHCEVYLDERHIHKTNVILKSNNPIWTCETGSLLLLEKKLISSYAVLRIEIFNRPPNTRKSTQIGVVEIPVKNLLNGSLCNEKRLEFELEDASFEHVTSETTDATEENVKMSSNSVNSLVANGIAWSKYIYDFSNSLLEIDMEIHSSYSEDSEEEVDDETIFVGDVSDDYFYGNIGTLALRFRDATKEDIQFLAKFNTHKPDAIHMELKTTLLGISASDGLTLAKLVTEQKTSFKALLGSLLFRNLLSLRFPRKKVNDEAMLYRSVKPNPDPARVEETKFMTKDEMSECCNSPSTNWIQAGSGSLGIVMLEILTCQGLVKKDIGRVFGNQNNSFVCAVYDDCLVETDVIPDCLNPMWMPWTQRAFVFNRMHALGSIYLAVFDHDSGPFKDRGCGRTTVDLREFEPNTVYNLTYDLFSSPVLSNRKSKGSIKIRLQLVNFDKKQTIMSMTRPRAIHVNVTRSKTLAVARYTCYGKYREEVYNLKILRSYVDELMEYLELSSYELSYALDSLIFWRGQVNFGRYKLPLHSAIIFLSTIYVSERLHLLPSFYFFTMAYCMLIIRNNRCHHPSPWFRCKSFIGCLRWCLFTQQNIHPVVIDDGEGHEEALEMEEVKRKRMEKDKENRLLQAQIANIRKKMQQLLGGFADYSIGTSEGVRGINPLNRLLPVQLLLRDTLYYVRSVKVLLSCNDSQILLFVTLSHIVLGLILLFVPWAYLLHWIFRIIIWVFLGPWMKALDILYQRRGSKQMEVVMEEIRQREQNIWIKARTKQEEGVKLKSMRIVRFGPYSFKVPTLNITRHYDYPLPESTAMPAEKYIVDTSELNIQKSIPGQIHVGVMIPRLHSHERNTLSRPNMEGTARKLQGIRKIEDMQFDTEGINSCSTGQDEGFELIAHNGVKGITGSFGVNVCATGIS